MERLTAVWISHVPSYLRREHPDYFFRERKRYEQAIIDQREK
jgi:hypothetical protein